MTMRTRDNFFFLFLVMVLGLASACGGYGESGIYRRSTLAPTAVAGVGNQPLEQGEFDVAGSVSTVNVRQQVPRLNDSDVHVAHTNAHGYLRLGVYDYLAFGIQGQYAHAGLSHPGSKGTVPLEERAAYGLGPMASLRFDLADELTVNFGLAVMYFNSPWSQWGYESNEEGDFEFSRINSGRTQRMLYRLNAGPYYQLDERFGLFGGLSVQNSLTNQGFTKPQSLDSTVRSGNDQVLAYVGGSYKHDTGVYLQLQAFVSSDDRTAPLGGQLTLGFQR